jgi:DNA modification methylase
MRTTERFEQVSIEKLVPYAQNARTHSKEQILQLRASLREFGFVNPVIVDKDFNIIAGHGRVAAAKDEGLTEVPCIFAEHLTETQKRAYILADNKLAENAGWDGALLALEFGELKDLGFDLELTGFSMDELEKLFSRGDKTEAEEDDFDIDRAAAEPPFVMLGDLWTLGRHRLLCGDATKTDDVQRLMGGKKANLLLTDPPYGVSYEGKAGRIANDDLRGEAFYKFLLDAFTAAEAAMDGDASAYIFHADTQGENFRRAFREAGFKLSGVCQWVKPSLVLGRSPYQWQNEPVIFGWKAKGKHKWYAGRAETTVWNFDKPKKNENHPTTKPIALLAYPIKNSTAPNAIVLDSFCGSGSTLIACEQTDRICYCLELDAKYAGVIVKRYIEAAGGANGVTVERDGQTLTYAEVSADG